MDIVSVLKCSGALEEELGGTNLTAIEELQDGEAENRVLIQVLAERLVQLEGELASINDKVRTAREAESIWQLAMRARDRAVFVNSAGEIAILPAHLVSVLAAGRAADVEIRIGKGSVTLDDERGSRCTIPLSFFVNLAKVLRLWNCPVESGLGSASSKTGVTS